MVLLALALALQTTPFGEDPVDPYPHSNANAGATPFKGSAMLVAFHGRAGVDRIADDLVTRIKIDPRIADILKGQDEVRLRRLLKEQFCYILNGGCGYSGRTMREGHKNLGLQTADVGALVEDLQAAMRKEGVPFAAQNRFLAKLAPIKRDAVER
ncbi:group 1 truncated hemoglobin [Sphingomonas sp. AAP5]|uniref:group I truncated hemoglobin n=1 Tax=Sphingomonas sp. AAP5 TaxID=1523415 RepID=UPI0010573D19|nr:group 1 truncated hemoglobin [Sphingomonas sp. AAP5]QBM75499.1 group 1 truncated hemoglobin [Sphingomonas sp. AAP5]